MLCCKHGVTGRLEEAKPVFIAQGSVWCPPDLSMSKTECTGKSFWKR